MRSTIQKYGSELIADLYGIEAALLRDEKGLVALVIEGLDRAGFTILARSSHRFDRGGQGITAAILLSESHAAIHSYPEWGYLAVDVFSCGRPSPDIVLAAITDVLAPHEVRTLRVRRDFSKPEPEPSSTVISYHDRRFVGVVNYDDGDFTRDTVFHYRQVRSVVWGTYTGGGVRFGTLIGRAAFDGRLDLLWQHVNTNGDLCNGTSISHPEILLDGRLRLHEHWSISRTGGNCISKKDSVVEGTSIVEEVCEPR